VTRARKWTLLAALAAVVLGLVGFLVASSGVMPIAASSGHWKITELILQFGKRRSVVTHALGVEKLALDRPWLVLKGAGHFETGCRPCHGSPDLSRPQWFAMTTPRAPDLRTVVPRYSPEQLFYIVKHGIKFTGMPAWSSPHRDDEVEAMVAFLLELPRLDGAAYRRLVDGDTLPTGSDPPLELSGEGRRAPRAVAASCARCHGADGRGRENAAFPKLAGQSREYLASALHAYAGGRRHSGIMQPIAAALTPRERDQLADYYAALPPAVFDATSAHPAALPGRAIAEKGLPEQTVPSCADCHGPSGERRNAAYPRLAGQHADYLALQLELFQRKARGGASHAHLMNHVVMRLRPEQLRDVAEYYASLGD